MGTAVNAWTLFPHSCAFRHGDLPTEATIAHVLVSKYADHLPLHRQSQILARNGLELHRTVLADWAGKASFHLPPVVDRLAEEIKRSTKLLMHKTMAPLLDLGRGTTKRRWPERTEPGAERTRPTWATPMHQDDPASMGRLSSAALTTFFRSMATPAATA